MESAGEYTEASSRDGRRRMISRTDINDRVRRWVLREDVVEQDRRRRASRRGRT